MAYDKGGVRMNRKEAVGMDELIGQYIREMKLAGGLNNQRVRAAWDEVTGAGSYTSSMYFKDGTLYCFLSSSMVRSHLYLQKDVILEQLNIWLSKDELFTADSKSGAYIRNLVLR